jgi:hypothetical protein
MPFSHQNKFLVALTVAIINLGWALPAEAQGDDERPPTRSTAPVSTPVPETSSTPDVLECRENFSRGELCPPAPSTGGGGGGGDDRRVIVDKPHACIYGELVSFTEHVRLRSEEGLPAPIRPRGYDDLRMVEDEVDMGGGSTADVGFGGVCHCPVGYELRPLASGYDANREVETQIDRRIDRQNSMQCVPRVGDTAPSTPPSVDLRPLIVWLEMHDDSICALRATALCRSAVEELNRCEATAQAARDNEAFEACFEQHHYTDSVTIQAGDAVVGSIESCVGATFVCSELEVFYAPVPALPSDEVGEGGQGQGPSIDIAVDLGASAFATGIRASSVEANAAIQFTLQPSTAMIAPTVRLRMGYGRMNDEGGIEIRRPMRLHLGLGVQLILAERVRLDVLATTGAIMSQNTNSNGNGDGIRADRGIGAELGLSIDLNRRGQLDSGVGLVPYLRLNAEVMSLRYNLANDQAEANYIRRTSYGFGVSFGIRFGQRGRR